MWSVYSDWTPVACATWQTLTWTDPGPVLDWPRAGPGWPKTPSPLTIWGPAANVNQTGRLLSKLRPSCNVSLARHHFYRKQIRLCLSGSGVGSGRGGATLCLSWLWHIWPVKLPPNGGGTMREGKRKIRTQWVSKATEAKPGGRLQTRRSPAGRRVAKWNHFFFSPVGGCWWSLVGRIKGAISGASGHM